MPIKTQNEGGLCRIAIDENMTIYTAREIRKGLSEIKTDVMDMEIDLSEVSEVDTSGLQLLYLLKKEAELTGRSLRFTALSPAVSSVIELYRMKGFFGLSD